MRQRHQPFIPILFRCCFPDGGNCGALRREQGEALCRGGVHRMFRGQVLCSLLMTKVTPDASVFRHKPFGP